MSYQEPAQCPPKQRPISCEASPLSRLQRSLMSDIASIRDVVSALDQKVRSLHDIEGTDLYVAEERQPVKCPEETAAPQEILGITPTTLAVEFNTVEDRTSVVKIIPADSCHHDDSDKVRTFTATRQISSLNVEVVESVEHFGSWLDGIRYEPLRTGVIADTIESNWFNILCSFTILFDSVCTCWSANQSAMNPKAPALPSLQILEVLISTAYTTELCLKLVVHRLYFFINENMFWNWFDFLLVILVLVDLTLLFSYSSPVIDPSFLRLVRFIKLGRALRLFRAVRVFTDLRVMVLAITNCLYTLLWAFVTLALFLYVSALLFVQSVTSYRAGLSDGLDPDTESVLETYFTSVQGALLVLYMCCTNGRSWADVYHALTNVGRIEAVTFTLFMFFFGFALTTILSGIFIEKALAASQPDRESRALENRRVAEQEVDELVQLMNRIDADRSGTLSLDELKDGLKTPYWRAILSTFDLDTHDALMLFGLLQEVTKTNEFEVGYFVRRLSRMKGTASAIDLQALTHQVTIMHDKIDGLIGKMPVDLSNLKLVSLSET